MKFTIFGLRFSIWTQAAAALVVAGLLSASSVQAETLLLKGATVHTVSGDTLSPGEVLIKDARIEAVGQSLAAPGQRSLTSQASISTRVSSR